MSANEHTTPTSFDSLLGHRAAHAEAPESRRVWLFHAHAYFDHESPEAVAEARAFMDRVARAFAAIPHVEVHSFVPHPAGPHPRGSFEVLRPELIYRAGRARSRPASFGALAR